MADYSPLLIARAAVSLVLLIGFTALISAQPLEPNAQTAPIEPIEPDRPDVTNSTNIVETWGHGAKPGKLGAGGFTVTVFNMSFM